MLLPEVLRARCPLQMRALSSLAFISLIIITLHPGAAKAANYRIDPKETTAGFEVWMLGLIPVRGNFRHTTGALNFDLANQSGNIEVLIDTSSLEVNSARAAAATRGAEFFNVEKYPRMDFRSSRFIFQDSHLHAIEGMLTLRGSMQPVTLAISRASCKPAVCRADATLIVKRSKFGMKAWSNSVGDDVTIRIALVAYVEIEETKTSPAAPPADAPKPEPPAAK